MAKLAKLDLTETEIHQFSRQLSETLETIRVLRELAPKVKNFGFTTSVSGNKNVFRPDKARPSLTQQEALSGAKLSYRGYFKTQAVFDS